MLHLAECKTVEVSQGGECQTGTTTASPRRPRSMPQGQISPMIEHSDSSQVSPGTDRLRSVRMTALRTESTLRTMYRAAGAVRSSMPRPSEPVRTVRSKRLGDGLADRAALIEPATVAIAGLDAATSVSSRGLQVSEKAAGRASSLPESSRSNRGHGGSCCSGTRSTWRHVDGRHVALTSTSTCVLSVTGCWRSSPPGSSRLFNSATEPRPDGPAATTRQVIDSS